MSIFDKKISVLYITTSAIQLAEVVIGKTPKLLNKKTIPWIRNQSLTPIFSKIALTVKGKNIRIVLSKDFTYVFNMIVPSEIKQNQEREFIKKELSNQIPEFLDNDEWDFKEIGSVKNGRKVLVFAPVQSFFIELSKVIHATKMHVEAIEAEDISKQRNIDPIIGVALKSDLKGTDERVLNIEPKGNLNPIVDDQTKKPTVDTNLLRKRLIQIAVISIGLIIVVASAYAILQLTYFKVEISPEVQEILSPQPSEPINSPAQSNSAELTGEPSPEPIDITDYSLKVLNGSGIPGASSDVVAILENEGFINLTTDNADSYDYTDTIIQKKNQVPDEMITILYDILTGEYSVNEGEMLTEDVPYDVLITVGFKRG